MSYFDRAGYPRKNYGPDLNAFVGEVIRKAISAALKDTRTAATAGRGAEHIRNGSADSHLESGSLALRNPHLRSREAEVTFSDGISGMEYGAQVRKAEAESTPPLRNMMF